MMETTMLKKEEFISFILDGTQAIQLQQEKTKTSAMPEGFGGFDMDDDESPQVDSGSTFAHRLLVASDFGLPAIVQTSSLLRNNDSVARHLPDRASYWTKTPDRPHQTLLFETDLTHRELLNIPAFKSRKLSHLDIVEDALARMVSEALDGFQKGGDSVTADVRKGNADETLCIVSILDERNGEPVRLACFGTRNAKTGGLETFHITEQTRQWERQLAKEHLALLYERQFKKLGSNKWQDAFTTTEERKLAEKLLEVCSKKAPTESEIQENVLSLLDTIAKGFGLRCKSGQKHRLQAFSLPSDHDIGIDSDKLKSKHGGNNPFGGVTLRDEKHRLLGYIVYPLKKKDDAAKLRKYLEKNNRFHNVLVVFPEGDETSFELWQGTDQLTGKLKKYQGFEGAANIVNLLSRFFVVSKAKVRNPDELAAELAYRARYLRRLAIKELSEEKEDGPLRSLYTSFKDALVHDQNEEEFADAFAQTLTYGLLASRWIGNEKLIESGERFTRQNSLKYLPTTSNFLSGMFKSALSVKLDDRRGRLLWLVDDIADLLDRIDVSFIFGVGDKSSDQITDPVIHFYEPFLAEYDKKLKNQRGVFFTPRPVVSYIVRSVSEQLKTNFGLEDGLASTDTWGDVIGRFPNLELPKGVKFSDPFVSILDPATGTGTFIYECITFIEKTMKDKWRKEIGESKTFSLEIGKRWNHYVTNHLIKILFGYEIMMASYSIAHLKIAFKLKETGYDLEDNETLNIYLTNTLEPHSEIQKGLVGIVPSLAIEAKKVNEIKKNKIFTVIIGNPPYAGHSINNQCHWIVEKVIDYRKEFADLQKPGQGKWLQDDYVKFIRFAEILIERAKLGTLGFITNNSFLTNPTFKGMRKHLQETFDHIYVTDLHGNLKRDEPPEGINDDNVFDIQQGVSITVASRFSTNSNILKISYCDLWGDRLTKYKNLELSKVPPLAKLHPSAPLYLLVPRDEELLPEYENGWRLPDIFSIAGDPAPGIVTTHDEFAIAFSKQEIIQNVETLLSSRNETEAREHFRLCKQNQWSYQVAKRDLAASPWRKKLIRILYRPFDIRYSVNDSNVAVHRRKRALRHMTGIDNLALCTNRQVNGNFRHVLCADLMVNDCALSTASKERTYILPLYVVRDDDELDIGPLYKPNINDKFLRNFENSLQFSKEKINKKKLIPEDIFYYIYSLLYSESYRDRYSEFLKSDFPRIQLPSKLEFFSDLGVIGKELVSLHLLKDPKINKLKSTFSGSLNSEIGKPSFSEKTIWTNKEHTCGFLEVSEETWKFKIGGYQVCEKWLKDRKSRQLSEEDIVHYQKIIFVVNETIRLMKAVDTVIDNYGGWEGAFCNLEKGCK